MGTRAVLNTDSVLLTKDEIQSRVRSLAQQINFDYRGEEVVVVCILKGAFLFFSDLVRYFSFDSVVDFIEVNSYEGEESTGNTLLKKELSISIKGKHVLLVDDILDTGLTLSNVLIYLSVYDPLSVKIAVLLDKPSRRQVSVKSDYVGFEIENSFVYGYGLDYNQRFRHLEDIRVKI